MKLIEAYQSRSEALTALDNGGRFFSWFSKANDGQISKAELGKVGGVFNDKQQMILFLEMALSKLGAEDQETILNQLEPKMQDSYLEHRPERYLPSEALELGTLSSNAIVKGIPRHVDSKEEFTGFIMFPISTGSTTTMVMVPLIEQYEVYHLYDESSESDFLIAHLKGKESLPAELLEVGGVLKELKADKKNSEQAAKFLEVLYYQRA